MSKQKQAKQTGPDSLEATWKRYASSWGPVSKDEREAIFRDSLEPTCVYRDPIATATGTAELAAYMEQFQSQIPGGHFVTTYFLAHSNRSIAKWEMRNGDSQVLGDGVSYGEYDSDGKLIGLAGFFEQPSS